MSTRYIRSNRKSKSRILSLLIADDGGIEKAAVAALDSDQVVSVINETSSGFDSDQVIAIINENASTGFDSDQVVAIIDENSSGGGGLGDYGAVNSTGTAASATGTDAIAIGETAIAAGSDGIAIGSGAYAHSAQDNISIGKNTLSGSTGSLNVAIGREAARNSGSANSSVYVGAWSGDGSTGHSSTYIGYAAGQNKSGVQNIAIGYTAFSRVGGNGGQNIFIGYRAGWDAISAYNNTAMGHQVLQNVTTGFSNTAVGMDAGGNLNTGYENVFIGKQAGQMITTGRGNVVIGVGGLSGSNTYNGQSYNCIYIGYGSISSGYRNSEMVFGVGLTGKGNSSAFMGGSFNYNPANSSSWNTTSDERIKTNVTDYTIGLDTLDQVNVKTYNYLSDSDIATAHPELADSDGLVHEGLDTTKTVVGLMAQDLETLLPDSVTTRDNGIKSVNKDELFWVMLNSIKELKALNDALTASNEALTVRVEALESN